jgi:hypothetical protein
MTEDKLLRPLGPLERLFAGSTCAPLLDFFMLAAEEGKSYCPSEIACFSGIPIKKAKIAIHNLHEMGLMIEVHEEKYIEGKSKKKNQKRYKLNRESNTIIPLEKLVLAVTDIEIKKPSLIPMQEISANSTCQRTEERIGMAASELIEKGLIKLDHQTEQD